MVRAVALVLAGALAGALALVFVSSGLVTPSAYTVPMASLTASITPVVFLTHGPAVTQAAAYIAQGMQAWSASVCGVVITAAASAVSGGVGYATARRQAVSELSALRGELSELRAMLTETRQGGSYREHALDRR